MIKISYYSLTTLLFAVLAALISSRLIVLKVEFSDVSAESE